MHHGIYEIPPFTIVQRFRDHIEKLKSDWHIHALLCRSLDLHNLFGCEKTILLTACRRKTELVLIYIDIIIDIT